MKSSVFKGLVLAGIVFSIGCCQASVIRENQPLHSDISIDFCILDAKYDGKKLKILEFGGGPRSGFDGYDNYFHRGAVWELFWNYLDQFKLPMWYLKTPSFTHSAGKKWLEFIAYEKFFELGGKFALNPEEVEAHVAQFCPIAQDGSYPDYNGIFLINVSRHRPEYAPINQAMRKKFSSAVFVNDIANKFVFNKSKSDRLFREDSLRRFRPKSMVCFKRYNPGLARKIIGTMGCDLFVIKPLNAQYGKGIIFVRSQDLDTMLKIILSPLKKALSGNDNQAVKFHKRTSRIPLSEAIDYWSVDSNSRFMIEEYVPSKLVEVEGRKYDATLRVIFTMHCINRQITITTLGGYWKLPTHAVDDEGSLNELHQSYQYDRAIISAPVDPVDMEHIRTLMTTALTPIYAKMIAQVKK
ncbi:MAG: hypothetical protein KC505_10930 [Myxococcales bacterium]|nr:hypothetical protein [Myxococcales bacterium]